MVVYREHIEAFFNILFIYSFILGLDGVNQADMLMNGGESKRHQLIINVDQYEPYTFGHGAVL